MEEDVIKLRELIRKDFYAFRNGIVADALKELYPKDTLIFGLTVPQFLEIAKKYPKNKQLASLLWNTKNIREMRLLSLYLFPIEEISKPEACELIKDVQSTEEAEFLSFRVLRHLSFAPELVNDFQNASNSHSSPLSNYCIEMLEKNLNQGN